MSKNPWIWSACRSIVSSRFTPELTSMLATTFAEIATRALRGRRSWRAYPKYGIAAVMRAALERRSASDMIMTSMSVSLVGAQVDWRMKQSLPRTFSRSSIITSPSLNFETVALPSWMFSRCATFCASFGFAVPVNTIRLSKAMGLPGSPATFGILAGEEGFEPSNAGIKIQCLNQLGDSPAVLQLSRQGVPLDPLRHQSLHRRGPLSQHAFGLLALVEPGEDAAPRT